VTGRRPGAGWPSASSPVVGVIGDPVAHSLSPLLHNAAFAALDLDWVSLGFSVPAGEAPGAVAGMRALGLRGLSVTMPHKEAAASLADRCSATAQALGAVNCLAREGQEIVGHNTDGGGFLAAVRRATGFVPDGSVAVVAGAGGAARAVVRALAEAGARAVVVVARTSGKAAAAAALAGRAGRVGRADDAAGADLVVNATPTGMAGAAAESEPSLVPASLLGPGQVAADLVYHPLVTPWLAAASARGATTMGGLGMLVHQAAAQITLWTGREAPVEAMWQAAQRGVRTG
jgi:shikimate dehydrogenase